jgi:hypothetical protein
LVRVGQKIMMKKAILEVSLGCNHLSHSIVIKYYFLRSEIKLP